MTPPVSGSDDGISVKAARSEPEQTIRQRAAQRPKDTWLKFKDREYSWQEVLSHVQRAANGLLELGVRPGERVAIMMGPEWDVLDRGWGAGD